MDRKNKIQQFAAMADRAEDVRLIQEIEARRKAIMRGRAPARAGEQWRELHVAGCTFRLNMLSAAASLDTLIDLWGDSAHMRLPAFEGQANRRVLDIGANEGYYSLRIKHQNSAAKVIALEPVQQSYDQLAANIWLNACRDVYALRAAASESDGPLTLQRHPAVPTVSGKNTEALNQTWIRREDLRDEQVQGYRLDTLMPGYSGYGFDWIDLIKIDVEGDELNVLKGAEDTLGKTSRIVIEWHTARLKSEVISFLEQRGFRLLREEGHRFGDLYFERST
ncbi:MAG: FkbM family methyltransferase [Spirochaetota bacterium]